MPKITRYRTKVNARRFLRKGIDPCTHKKITFYCKYCETEYIKHNQRYEVLGENDIICYSCYATETQRSMFRRLYEKINDKRSRKGDSIDHSIIVESMKRAEWFGEDFYEKYLL